MPPFVQKLRQAAQTNRSLLCVGLDPDPARMPIRDVAEFNIGIIRATADLVCAYKPNFPFYEALGMNGTRLSPPYRGIPRRASWNPSRPRR